MAKAVLLPVARIEAQGGFAPSRTKIDEPHPEFLNELRRIKLALHKRPVIAICRFHTCLIVFRSAPDIEAIAGPGYTSPFATVSRGAMFPKGLGGLGDMGNMLKNAMALKENIDKLKESLGDEIVEASAGGGMVTVVMNGRMEVQSVKIDPDVITPDDPEMLETLVAAALNEATRKAQEMVKEKMTEITGGIDIPGLTA